MRELVVAGLDSFVLPLTKIKQDHNQKQIHLNSICKLN